MDYNAKIEKPAADNLGPNVLIIKGVQAKYPADLSIIVRIAEDDKSLVYSGAENDGEMNMPNFEAKINTDKSIDFKYLKYRLHVNNMGYEKGEGKAVKN